MGEYNCRRAIRDVGNDIYFSGWMDCYDWLSGIEIKKQKTFTVEEILQLQSKIYVITGEGEIMELFNQMLVKNSES